MTQQVQEQAIPHTLPVRAETIPAELREREQWVCWQWEGRVGKNNEPGKWTKVPVNSRTGDRARTNDAQTWADFPTTTAYAQMHPLTIAGIGYVFAADDPYTGIDFDQCRDAETGTIDAWAATQLAAAYSYAEVSPSEMGVKQVVRATLPGGGIRRGRPDEQSGGPVEMYDAGRFFTMTGHYLSNMPSTIHEAQEAVDTLYALLATPKKRTVPLQSRSASADTLADGEIVLRAMRAKNGDKFAALLTGNTAGYTSQSEADLALCSLLAFWTGPDPARIDRLFRQSQLMRPKWDEARGEQTYGQGTIAEAVAGRTEYWMPKSEEQSSGEERDGASPLVAGPYVIQDGRICHRRRTREGEVFDPLANFSARITEEVARDDGVMTTGELVIEGVHESGAHFPPARVSLTQFHTMNWPVAAWGTRAVVAAGMGAKDRLREAIQRFSPDSVRRTEYAYTGWCKIGGAWCYLHANGAIGATGAIDGVTVALSPALRRIAFSAVQSAPAGLVDAVRASLAVLDVAPDAITVPLLAAVYRAPLNEIASADATVALIGPTGAQKSELAGLGMQHFGAGFSRLTLPGSWYSTPNALERLVFEAKDALCVIDDFKPGGTLQDVARLHQAADRLIRGVGNGASRGRMRAEGGLRPETPPRAFLLITGEETPRGESLRGRMAITEVALGDVRLDHLSRAQAHGVVGIYAVAMAGYLQWLAPQLDTLRTTAETERIALRDAARKHKIAHARTPDVIAHLAFGWQMWLAFAEHIGAITEAEHAVLWNRVWSALDTLAARQREHQQTEEPTRRFLALLSAAIGSWDAHLADVDGQAPVPPEAFGWQVIIRNIKDQYGLDDEERTLRPQGKRAGWVEEDNLFLDLHTAHAVVQRMATAGGESFPISPQTLSRRLHEKGLLRSDESSRDGYTVRRTLEGRRRGVLHLHINALSSPKDDQHDHDTHERANTPPAKGASVGSTQETGRASSSPSKEDDHGDDQDREETGTYGYGGHSGQGIHALPTTDIEPSQAFAIWTPLQVRAWLERVASQTDLADIPAGVATFGATRGVRRRRDETPAAYVARLRAAVWTGAA